MGLWTKGNVYAYNSTFHDNVIDVEAYTDASSSPNHATVVLSDCIVSNDATTGGTLYVVRPGSSIDPGNSLDWDEGISGLDPQYVNGTNFGWSGWGSDFNSLLVGPWMGYYQW